MKNKIFFFLLFSCLIPSVFSGQNWQSLGTGADRFVTCMYVDSVDNLMYVGGDFIYMNGKKARGIATWDGVKFDTLQQGMDVFSGSFPEPLKSITGYQGKIYVGGFFTTAGAIYSPYIATWNGISWDSLQERFNNPIQQLLVNGSDLYACGAFSKIGNITYNSIAKYDGVNWSAVGDNSVWNTGIIKCICFYKGELYIGGRFYNSLQGINNIAKWNGSAWVGLPGIYGSLANVKYMKVYNNELYVGGLFNKSDGNVGNNIMKWDSTQWSEVGGGTGVSYPSVEYMDLNNGYLYAVGNFSKAGGIPAAGIARWDGTNWCGFNTLFDNTVGTMAFYNDSLYLGGGFWTINSDSMHSISKWIGGNYVDTCGHLTIGIKEENDLNGELNIYPNPSTNQIVLEFSTSTENASIEIINVLGQVVECVIQQRNHNNIIFNIEKLPKGAYFVQFHDDHNSITKKFIKN